MLNMLNHGPKDNSLVFVYGTLKKGFHNHYIIKEDEKNVYLSEACTVSNLFDMKSFGVHTFPFVARVGSYRIAGELWSVTEETMLRLDHLEGNGHLYKREPTKLIALREGRDKEPCTAWMYVFLHEDLMKAAGAEGVHEKFLFFDAISGQTNVTVWGLQWVGSKLVLGS